MRELVDRVGSAGLSARWLGVNLVFAVCHPAMTGAMSASPPSARSLVINLTLFLLPAAGWTPLFRGASRMPGMRLARALAVAAVVFLGVLAANRVLGTTLTSDVAWTTLWLFSNIGFASSAIWARPMTVRRSLLDREVRLGAICFLGAYGLFFWGATRVVPPQEDQDLEVLGTGFGLLTRFEPLLLTDRRSVYFFAHPPLLHVQVGGAYLLYGALAELQFYDAASQRVRDGWEGRVVSPPAVPIRLTGHPRRLPVEPGTYRIARSDGTEYVLVRADGTQVRVPIESVELDQVYARYKERPALLETRTPNIFFAACTVTLLAIWAGRISRKWWLGLLAAAAYATSPEVFVRSSYGGYFAAGGLVSILVLLAADRWRRSSRPGRGWLPAFVGAAAALIDHKLVLLPAAIGLHHAWRHWRRPAAGAWREWVHPIVIGFTTGTAVFWLWGLSIAPAAFVADHVRGHLVDRIIHHNPFGYGGYPTPLGLWLEFARHTGCLMLPAGVGLMLWDAWRSRVGAIRRTAPDRESWLLWMVLSAIAFSFVDWRMTKHIMPLALPLCLGLIPNRGAPRWRLAVPVAVLVVVLAFNLTDLATLTRDFTAFKVTPVW